MLGVIRSPRRWLGGAASVPDLTARRHHGLGSRLHADCSGLPAMASRGPPGRATTSRQPTPATSRGPAVHATPAPARHTPRGPREATNHRIRGSVDTAQRTACFTSAAILASSAAVNAVSAKATGHMAPSSRFAATSKPKVAYRDLNLSAAWKKQTTLPSLA